MPSKDPSWRLSRIFGRRQRPTTKTHARPSVEALEDRQVPTVYTGSVIGAGSALSGQDQFAINATSNISTGTPQFGGTVSFSDSKANVRVTATSITSLEMSELNPAVGTTTTNGYFVVSGRATLNDSTTSYSFTATGSLPFPANGTPGGIRFQVSGANGTVYSSGTSLSNWDPGETVAMTIDSLAIVPKVTLTSSANPATVGQSVAFTVAVAPPSGSTASASGTVTLKDGDTVIGSTSLVSGSAKFTTSALTAGSHTLVATYSGNAALSPATGSLTETINPRTPVTPPVYVVASANPAIAGQAVTFTVYVGSTNSSTTGGPPAGTVTLKDGDTVIGTQTLANQQVKFTTSSLTVGSHTLTANYSGSELYNPATGTLTETINPRPLTTSYVSISSSANPATVGQAVTFTVFVGPTSTAMTGTVTLKDGDTEIGTATVVNNQVKFTTSSLAIGSHTITANYSGNDSFGPATGKLTETIKSLATPTVSVFSSANPAMAGQAVTFTVYVSPNGGTGYVTGTVTLKDGDSEIGTATIANGQVKFTTSTLAVGDHPITATYSGSDLYTSATGRLTQTVKSKTLATPYVYIASSANPSKVGQDVTFTVYVGPSSTATPIGGTVTLKDGDTVVGTATLANQTVKFTVSNLTQGIHSITAWYGGNSSFAPASGSLTQTVRSAAPYTPTASISSSAPTAVLGQAVTFTVVVKPGVGPAAQLSGSVTLYDGTSANPMATVTLVNGQATYTTSSLKVGTHTIVAVYSGNTAFGSAAASMSQTIKTLVQGSVSGQGTVNGGQQSLTLQATSSAVNGAPTYFGSLTFSDAKTGSTFTATSITSVQLNLLETVPGTTTTNGYFTVTGYATLNGGTKLYAITVTGSLPFPGNNTPGGMTVKVTGDGVNYTLPFAAWDAGETFAITVN